ncbi:MAG: acyl-CoA dehydrogenase family protein [Chloroflexi bacterium]|nr:acyl-CoA dehydrogenase family protein [Chloroflexota bacterium]
MEFELAYTPEQEAFRKEVRTWLEAIVPAGISQSPREEDHPREEWEKRREVGRKLGTKGWLWPTMSPEYGGGGLTMDHAIILDEELERLGLSSPPYYDSGGRMGAPSILVWGTDEQKKAFLPPIFKGELVSWQLLTEPEAGSDLASVRTLATKDGDDYVINGHKTFVGGAHGVDQLWTICMTDPKAPRHENVSWFMIPANLPGITIMPLDLMGSGGEGGAPGGHKNSVFFDNVRVPSFNLVGGENNGWKVATTHLEIEHGGGGRIGRNLFEERLMHYCKATLRDGAPTSKDQDARDLLADLHAEAEINRLFGLRNFWLVHARKPRSYGGPQSSYYRKMTGLANTGRIGKLLGYQALTGDAQWGAADGYAEAQQRSGIVAVHPGGTADVQKLIMARRIGIGRTQREEAGRLE